MPLELGTVTIQQPNRTTITASKFAPKPDIVLSDINDVYTVGAENGQALVYISANNRYEFEIPIAVIEKVDGGQF
jgi:hypothetical protein